MAKTTTTPEIDPEGQYRVMLVRAVEFRGRTLKPRNENIVKGKYISELGDAVSGYEKV